MGRFTHFIHLMSGGKGISKDIVLNRRRLLELWKEHLQNYAYREDLARLFKPGELNNAKVVKSNRYWEDLQPVLDKIEALISKDLINIDQEEKREEDILSDLKALTSDESRKDIIGLTDAIVNEFNKLKPLIQLFKKAHDILKLELHLIRLIRTKPKNFVDLLRGLFKLIFHEESRIYRIFKEEEFVYDKAAFFEVERIATAIFLGEELKEEEADAEKVFVKLAVKIMGDSSSENEYRKIGEYIYIELAKLIHPIEFQLGNVQEWSERFRELVLNDVILTNAIKAVFLREHKQLDEKHLKSIILAFRKSYGLEHFIEIEEYIAHKGILAVLG